jgi:phage shock protein A
MPDHIDIDGLSAAQAKQYVVSYIATLKQTQNQRKKLADDLSTWKSRVALAREKGREDLAAKAQAVVSETEDRLRTILAEERELEFQVIELKRQLDGLKHQARKSIDAEALLAQLQSVVGEPDELKDELENTELDLELEKLKKKLDES